MDVFLSWRISYRSTHRIINIVSFAFLFLWFYVCLLIWFHLRFIKCNSGFVFPFRHTPCFHIPIIIGIFFLHIISCYDSIYKYHTPKSALSLCFNWFWIGSMIFLLHPMYEKNIHKFFISSIYSNMLFYFEYINFYNK